MVPYRSYDGLPFPYMDPKMVFPYTHDMVFLIPYAMMVFPYPMDPMMVPYRSYDGLPLPYMDPKMVHVMVFPYTLCYDGLPLPYGSYDGLPLPYGSYNNYDGLPFTLWTYPLSVACPPVLSSCSSVLFWLVLSFVLV